MFQLINLVQSGGWMIVPILLTSIVTVALIFEAAWLLGQAKKRFEAFRDHPASLGSASQDPLARFAAYRLSHPQASSEALRFEAEEAFAPLDRKISWLQTLAAIAPLLGLLGTVSGMIHNFSLVATTRPTNPLTQLSAGISEALVSTGGGLVVAIIAAVGFHWLTNELDALLDRLLRAAAAKSTEPVQEASVGS